jgi:lysophospholipid acyltransferase (LPLAT)-like uncharacterized protein
MKSIKPTIPLDYVSAPVLLLSKIIGSTWIYSINDKDHFDPVKHLVEKTIFCFWHTNLLPVFYYLRKTQPAVLVSSSRDGQRLSAVLERWGFTLVRGSSTKGGNEALIECVQKLEGDQNLLITPDGPRGPAMQAKFGTAKIALNTGALVIPLVLSTNRSWRIRSWDRFTIPKPFARIRLTFGQSVDPEHFRGQEKSLELLTKEIQAGLSV